MSAHTARIANYRPIETPRVHSEAFERFMAELEFRSLLARALDLELTRAARAGEFA